MPDVAVDRALPHNLEAERSVLGAILIHNDAFNAAAEVLNPRDFFRDAHRRIFEKMVQLSERGNAIDFITLKEELSRSGELDEVGGPAYIAALVDGLPHATNIEYYARIVREKSTLRNLIFSANKILANAYEAEQEPNQILDDAEQAIFAIAEDRVRAGFVSMRALAHAGFETIERAHERKQLITGVPSGFADLDELTAGFQPGDLVIVAARPSVGKTALALNVAQHVGTRTGRTVGIFSLEMSKEQLFLRMLTSEARIDSHRLRTGFLVESDWGRLSHALGALSEAKIYIDDTPGMGVLEMRAKARRLAAEHGLDLLVVDYIQLMQGRGRFENRTLEVASISRSLKGLAKELNVPLLVISQLSRAPESRSDHRPMLSDLRECVAGDTLVMLTDGRRVPVRDLVETTPEVWSVTSEGTLQPARAEKVWLVGTRRIRRVRLASGRSMRVTGEHRLLAGGGWTRVNDLRAGDRLAVARRLPEAEFGGTSYGGASHFQVAPSRAVALEYADLLDSSDLRSATTSDLFWDRIVSIEPAGDEEVYDLTVPGSACWLADGIVSHNSGALEQDADVVVLLFRPDQYPDVKPEDENIAELNVAKQRNGPTGLVRLAFLKQETRFGNLEQRQ